jgi:hypothetical protein
VCRHASTSARTQHARWQAGSQGPAAAEQRRGSCWGWLRSCTTKMASQRTTCRLVSVAARRPAHSVAPLPWRLARQARDNGSLARLGGSARPTTLPQGTRWLSRTGGGYRHPRAWLVPLRSSGACLRAGAARQLALARELHGTGLSPIASAPCAPPDPPPDLSALTESRRNAWAVACRHGHGDGGGGHGHSHGTPRGEINPDDMYVTPPAAPPLGSLCRTPPMICGSWRCLRGGVDSSDALVVAASTSPTWTRTACARR